MCPFLTLTLPRSSSALMIHHGGLIEKSQVILMNHESWSNWLKENLLFFSAFFALGSTMNLLPLAVIAFPNSISISLNSASFWAFFSAARRFSWSYRTFKIRNFWLFKSLTWAHVLTLPPVWTCFSTCAMNFCAFPPFTGWNFGLKDSKNFQKFFKISKNFKPDLSCSSYRTSYPR